MAEVKSYLDKEGLILTIDKLKRYADKTVNLEAEVKDDLLVLAPLKENITFEEDGALNIAIRADELLKSSSISYSNSASPRGVETVKEALDELYSLILNS